MIAVPYLALPMYILFGRRKLPRKVLRWSGMQLHGEHWAEDLIGSFGLAPAAPSAVRLHQDGSESAAALFATMSRAAVRRVRECWCDCSSTASAQSKCRVPSSGI
jgi:cardiolipin synthase